MLFTNMFSVLAGGLIALNAGPLARLLYHDESIAFYLLVLGPVLPGMYLDSMGDAVLKGLGEEVATFRYSIWDSTLRIALVILLLPRTGMKGFLFVMLVSNISSALLNIFRISKVADIRTRWYRWFLQPTLLFGVSALAGQLAVRFSGAEGDIPALLISCAVTGGLFCLLLLRCGLGDIIRSMLSAQKKTAGAA